MLSLRALLRRALAPLVWVVKIAFVTAGVIAVGWTGRALEVHVRSAPAFSLREIDIQGQERLTREALLAIAELEEGQNAFEDAPEDVAARLEGHAWIAEAHVVRRLPGTFRIRVREHRAACVLMLDEAYLVSRDGRVFKRLEPSDPADLPVVTGMDPHRFVTDRAYRTERLAAAVAMLHDYDAVGLAEREPLSEIHVTPAGHYTIFAGDAPTEFRLGPPPHRERLVRLNRVLDRLATRELEPAYVYADQVRRPERVTVRLRGHDIRVR